MKKILSFIMIVCLTLGLLPPLSIEAADDLVTVNYNKSKISQI